MSLKDAIEACELEISRGDLFAQHLVGNPGWDEIVKLANRIQNSTDKQYHMTKDDKWIWWFQGFIDGIKWMPEKVDLFIKKRAFNTGQIERYKNAGGGEEGTESTS